ncbi:hypothetical protein QJS10_CPB21g00680 [Acorus calamus]|uniref:Uncharacterized protein n=1 Tax=Acorus calamus TaxID=4465 RepID=A0AAV9C5E4_ACOCL|nr:hypothetical protein QJS10_CPB21g00680 [Acorus calamus]
MGKVPKTYATAPMTSSWREPPRRQASKEERPMNRSPQHRRWLVLLVRSNPTTLPVNPTAQHGWFA